MMKNVEDQHIDPTAVGLGRLCRVCWTQIDGSEPGFKRTCPVCVDARELDGPGDGGPEDDEQEA